MRYLFQLGREPELSTAEIKAVFSLLHISHTMSLWQNYAIIETEKPIDVNTLMNRLGGTIKIAEEITTAPTEYLSTAQPTGKILFSLSGESGKQEALTLKKALTALNRSVRYIELKNTATILHNDLVARGGDLTVAKKQVFVTKTIQPIEALSLRDYNRPARDAKSGMLPPKLAQMMINLAEVPTAGVILDPFCGSGTVLMEAALMGYKRLIGSDISPKAIDDTKKNMAWAKKELGMKNYELRTIQCDAKEIHKKIPPHSVDAIITESYLGKPLRGNETKSFLDTQAKELERLYLQTFTSFKKILKPGGTIIFVTPAFRYEKEWLHISLPLMGAPFTFARPDQRVGRDIWKYQSTN